MKFSKFPAKYYKWYINNDTKEVGQIYKITSIYIDDYTADGKYCQRFYKSSLREEYNIFLGINANEYNQVLYMKSKWPYSFVELTEEEFMVWTIK